MTAPDAHLAHLLDAGAVGLRFFSGYLPCAHRLGVAGAVSVERLRERYDEQRDLDVVALAADAAALTRLAGEMHARVEEQAASAAGLSTAWSGAAGDTAHDVLGGMVGRGATLEGVVLSIAEALAATADGIVAAVEKKSCAAAEFDGATIGSRGVAEVETIMVGAAGTPGGPTAEQLVQWSASGAVPPDSDAVAQWCERWLAEVFVPGIEAAIETFVRICDDADHAVEELFDALAGSFGDLDLPASDDNVAAGRFTGGTGTVEASELLESDVDLVNAAAGFAVAVGGLAEAVLGLATVTVEGATAIVEQALPEQAGAGTAGPERVAEPAESRPEPVADTDRHDSSDAGVPEPDVNAPQPPAGVADGSTGPSPPIGPRPEPEPRRENETGSTAQSPIVAGALPRRRDEAASPRPVATGEVPAAENTADRHEPPEGGVVLAEAGPL